MQHTALGEEDHYDFRLLNVHLQVADTLEIIDIEEHLQRAGIVHQATPYCVPKISADDGSERGCEPDESPGRHRLGPPGFQA
eukprot:2958039-Prymnesium_polylepis.1